MGFDIRLLQRTIADTVHSFTHTGTSKVSKPALATHNVVITGSQLACPITDGS